MVGHSRGSVSPYDANAVLDVNPAYDEEFNEQYPASGRRNNSTASPGGTSPGCRKLVLYLGLVTFATAIVTTTVILVDRKQASYLAPQDASTTSSNDSSLPQEVVEDVPPEEHNLFGSSFEISGVDKDNEHDMIGHDIDPVDIHDEAGGAGGQNGFLGEIVTGQDVGGNGNGKQNGHKKEKHVVDNIMEDEGDAGGDDDNEIIDCACITKNGNMKDKGRQQIKNDFESREGKKNGRNLMSNADEVRLKNGNVIVTGVKARKGDYKALKEKKDDNKKWKDKQNGKAEFDCDETVDMDDTEPCDESVSLKDRKILGCFEDDDDEEEGEEGRRRLANNYGSKPWHYPLGQGGGIGMKKEIYKALVTVGVYDTKFQPEADNDSNNIWRVLDQGSQDVTVCIVDSGYDYGHPDLPDEPQVTGDDYLNPSGGDGQPRYWKQDGTGHGTQIAGIIAAKPNDKIDGEGVYYVEGVAPSTKLHIVRAFDDNGAGDTNDLIHTLQQCRTKGVDVINLSLRYGENNFVAITNLLTDMYEEDGIVTFSAAGNVDANYPRGALTHPAAIPSVVSVTGINNGYHFPAFSNRNEQVELVARGNGIPTTNKGSGYYSSGGTSFSAPFGCGVTALLLSHYKGICTPKQVRSCMAKMAKVCNTGLSSYLPKCEVCTRVDLETGLKICPNQDPLTSPCPRDATLSECGNYFSPPAICDQTDGTCCDEYSDVNNSGYGHGVMQAKATHDALSQDCGCGTPTIQTTTSNICDSPCTPDLSCSDGVSCTTDCKTESNVCINIPNDFGPTCGNIDHCNLGTDNSCHPDATCNNIPSGYTCLCNTGYSGNGVTCIDDDECALDTHNCHADATCTNTEGDFSCSCNEGYGGDGVTCTYAPTDIPSVSPSGEPSRSPTASPEASPSSGPSNSPSSIPSAAPSSLPSSTPSSLPSSAPSNTPSSMILQFIEDGTRSPALSYQGPKQYEEDLGITSQEDSCVVLKEMNDNTSDDRCKDLSYDFDLICPSEANKGDGDNTKFRLFSTLTCAASGGINSSDEWHMHAKWQKNNGDWKDWDDRRKCSDDRNGKSLKDLGCSNNVDDIPVATVKVWFYAAEVDTEPDNWEDATATTDGYCYFQYEMKCNCGDCD